jgi:hypothetical protein
MGVIEDSVCPAYSRFHFLYLLLLIAPTAISAPP